MNWDMAVFRIIHILLGVFWAGALFFFALFLLPSVRDAGPDGAKIMGALQRRRYVDILPIIAIFTILSGFWLYWRVSGGFEPAYMGSKYGMAYGLGGVTALMALAIGLVVVRPSAMRTGRIMQAMPSTPEGPERQALMNEVQKLRQRATTGSQVVAVLLAVTVILMAVTRYL